MKPWMSDELIDFLDKLFSERDLAVLEWGGGKSTIRWAPKAKSWLCIEHDKLWVDEILRHCVDPGLSVYHYPPRLDKKYEKSKWLKYRKAPKKLTPRNVFYDLVIIDGKDRVNCARYASVLTRKGAIIIVDDWERTQYHEILSWPQYALQLVIKGRTGKTSHAAIFKRT